jgi:hypothetical protein
VGVYSLPAMEAQLGQGVPNSCFPSDHLSIKALFAFS